MSKKLIYLVSSVLVLSMSVNASADLIAHWRFDEGSGSTATDIAGNNDGTLEGDATWAVGLIGGALEFNGEGHVDCGNSDALNFATGDWTISAWIKTTITGGGEIGTGSIFANGGDYGGGIRFTLAVGEADVGGAVVLTTDDDSTKLQAIGTRGLVNDNEWHHIVGLRNGNTLQVYVDGLLDATIDNVPTGYDLSGTSQHNAYIGAITDHRDSSLFKFFIGLIDDVRIYNEALTEPKILAAMEGREGYLYAFGPVPADGAMHPDTWANLSWFPGDFAVSHDVYLGDNFDDVNEATRDSDVFRINQTTTFYDAGSPGFAYPDGLLPSTTYYWRIDEVNDTEPNSPWKGPVWSFSIPPKTAYAPDPADGAESVDPDTDLSWTGGLGSESHTVYFGDNFDDVNNATGGLPQEATTYSPGPIKMTKTYYWRVDEFDAVATYKGDVWSFTTQGAIGSPNPPNGAVDVKQTPILSWNPGAYPASHQVYFGADENAVKNADTNSPDYKGTRDLGDESYDPGKLEWETTYYWRVDEVNDANPDSPWIGPVWSFTTADFLLVDDFESYNDLDPADPESNRIFNAWIDGYDNPTNGSLVGYDTPPFAEQTIVHSGNQSMPLYYDNSVGYSEATLTLSDTSDWTEEVVVELSLWFSGLPPYVGSFTEGPAGTYTMTGSGADIWNNADEFHYAFKTLTGTGSIVARIQSVSNTNNWAKAGVMIRETLDPGSKHATMVVTPGQGVSFQRRTVTDSGSTDTTTGGISAPHWVKIERGIGSNFSAYYSADGVSWQLQGTPENIQMGLNIYIGLAVTSHDAARTCEAVFSNVTTTGTVGTQWANQDIGILSNAAEPLYVAVSNAGGAPAIVVHDDPGAATIDTWTEWLIPLQAFADQGVNLANVNTIALGLGNRKNPQAGGSGTMYFDDIRLYPLPPEPAQ